MATNEIEEWSKIDASNNFTPEEGGWPEGMNRSDVNDAARADMGALRRWYDDPEWLNVTVNAALTKQSATVITIVGDFTSPIQYFPKGTRIKITGGAQDPVYATVTIDAIELIGNTIIELKDFDGHTEVPTSPGVVRIHHSPQVRAEFKRDPVLIRVSLLTDVGIQIAIDDLEAAGGGIIVLDAKATYIIQNTVIIGAGASNGNIRIIGRGATLKLDDAVDDEILRLDSSGPIPLNAILEDLVFDGNAANQTAASTGLGLIQIADSTSFVWIRTCHIFDSYGHGIILGKNNRKIWIGESVFDLMGEDGISISDVTNQTEQIYIERCVFDQVANTAAITQGAGIHFAGRVHISDCTFADLNHATSIEIGINARIKGSASPSDESGRESTISGCRFEGTGTNARGIFLEGRDVLITACTFNLTGSGSEGIFAEGVANMTERHIITGCGFTSPNRAVRFHSSAEDCIVQGCVFESCDFPYTDEGKRNRFIANNLTNGIDGISVNSPALDPVISNNTVDTFSDDAIVIAPGVTGAQILHNQTTNITGDHLQDGGTATGQIGGHSGYKEELFFPTTLNAVSVTTTETLIAGFLAPISAYADGNRVWVVESGVIQGQWPTDTTPNQVTIRLRHGPTSGTPTSDTEITRVILGMTRDSAGTAGVTANDGWDISLAHAEFTPASGDDVYITAEVDASTMALDFLGADDTFDSYFRVRPK